MRLEHRQSELDSATRLRHLIWLVGTGAAVLLACGPTIEFGLLYFMVHEAPLFVIWAVLGLRAALFSCTLVAGLALFTWGLASPADWAVTVLISPIVVVGMSILKPVFRLASVTSLAISSWLLIGSPLVFVYLFIATGGKWDAAFASVSFLLISGASCGVAASLIVSIIRRALIWSGGSLGTRALLEEASLPEQLESALVLVTYIPLMLLVYYSAESYLDQTYEQIEKVADKEFSLLSSGVPLTNLNLAIAGDESGEVNAVQDFFRGRVIFSKGRLVHWIPEEQDFFRDRRYKKLSEFTRGVVTVFDRPADEMLVRPSLIQDDTKVLSYEASFWDYFKSRFQSVAAWYAGIVVVLWGSALFIRMLLQAYLVPLKQLADNMRDFRVGMEPITPEVFQHRLWTQSSEVTDLSDGMSRLQMRVNEDLDEIEKISRNLEKALHVKSQFLASMSHDMRTPLTSIKGFSELLHDDEGSAAQRREWLVEILRNTRYLHDLVNNVLDMAAIENDAIKIKCEDFELGDMASEVLDLVRPMAATKALALTLSIDENLPASVNTDRSRLTEILMNLLTNAIKYTDEGSISLDIGLSRETQGNLLFCVTDTGRGIAPDAMDVIFDPFTDSHDDIDSPKEGGMGLGLSIAKSLSEALGGSIEVESQVGTGSRFMVTIPAELEKSQRLEIPTEETNGVKPLAGIKVLVCEDSAAVLELIRVILERDGAQVEVAANGLIGRDLFNKELEGSRPFDLVVTDMQMPFMSGYELARSIRRLSKLPIVALTAFSQQEDKKKCLDAGCTHYMTKPVDSRTFGQSLATVLAKART